jgi:F-type H+-transporting ATPase subunit epsilon
MAGTLTLKLITPERVVLEREVDMVVAKGTAGEFAIMPGHEPLVATLALDILRFTSRGEEDIAAVLGGLLEVRGNEVTVLSDVAELADEIDDARAKQAKERAEAEKTQKTDKLDVYVSEMALGKAIARLKAAEMSRVRRKGRSGNM